MAGRRRLPWLPGKRRAVVRAHGQELLLDGRLSADDRERLELLLDWLDRPEPALTFPGSGRSSVHDTCVDEIAAMSERVHGARPW